MKIVHIAPATVFLPSFIEIMTRNGVRGNQHSFYLDDSIATSDIDESENVQILNKGMIQNFILYLKLVFSINKADKVFLHGLFNPKIILIMFFMPWVLYKSYWIIWGADLYGYKFGSGWKNRARFLFVTSVAKKIGHMVTYIKGDYENAVKWFGSKAKYHECFMYKSNIFKEYSIPKKFDNVTNILVGNSADPMNNHADIFEKMQDIKNKKIKIYLPLSYGDKEYAKEIIKIGSEKFGTKIEFITEIMPFDAYLDFLAKIDIVIFNHPYQQAMGNTISLLGLGKKVYMRSDVTQWELFKKIDVAVYDIEEFTLNDVSNTKIEKNRVRVKKYFSEETFLIQLREVFD